MGNSIRDKAFEYLNNKFSVVPMSITLNHKTGKKEKKPIITWNPYQEKYPTENEINTWWAPDTKNQIAIVTGKISNLAVIDIDDEKANDVLNTLIPDSLEIPMVKTPRGGRHLYFQCPDEKLRNDTGTIPGADLRANGGLITCPPTTDYVWLNPLVFPLPILPQQYIDYIRSHSNQKNIQVKANINLKYFEEGRRDSDLFSIANSLIKDNVNLDFVSDALRRIIMSWGEQDEKWIEQKIESALNRETRKHENLHEEIKEYIDNSTGEFNIYDLDRELGFINKEQKKSRTKVLYRLTKQDLIEKIGKRTGNYRLILKDENIIDWRNADITNTYDIVLPFQIHDLVNIYPKNIIVIAGVPDAGKSAFLLNVLYNNMHKHNIFYFSSEMREQEFHVRLSKFPKETNWNFKAIDRTHDFIDVIRPDDFNIIDFYEIHDNFFNIGEQFTKIHNKLKKGICIIAIQKKKGADIGRGAEFSLEKARLYLAMDSGELRIIKAKNWKNSAINPNGRIFNFSLINGCEFIQTNLITNPYNYKTTQYKE